MMPGRLLARVQGQVGGQPIVLAGFPRLPLRCGVVAFVPQGAPGVAWPIRLPQRFPMRRRIPALPIGMGFQPLHARRSTWNTLRGTLFARVHDP